MQQKQIKQSQLNQKKEHKMLNLNKCTETKPKPVTAHTCLDS